MRYEIEVKYFPCEGIDYVEHTLGSHSLWGAAWVVLRTLVADLLEVEWQKELKLHPGLACEGVPGNQVLATRSQYLDGLVLKYVAMSKYLHNISLGCSKILQVAVIIPTLGNIYGYNSVYGKADEVQRRKKCREISNTYYNSIDYFKKAWRKCTKILLISERDILHSCACGAVFPRGDDFKLFHTDYFHLNEVGMGKLVCGTCKYLTRNYSQNNDMSICTVGRINSARVDNEVDAIAGLVDSYTVRSPRVTPRQSGWGWSTKTIELLHGCERCLTQKKAQSHSEEQKQQAVDHQIDLLIAKGFWLED